MLVGKNAVDVFFGFTEKGSQMGQRHLVLSIRIGSLIRVSVGFPILGSTDLVFPPDIQGVRSHKQTLFPGNRFPGRFFVVDRFSSGLCVDALIDRRDRPLLWFNGCQPVHKP